MPFTSPLPPEISPHLRGYVAVQIIFTLSDVIAVDIALNLLDTISNNAELFNETSAGELSLTSLLTKHEGRYEAKRNDKDEEQVTYHFWWPGTLNLVSFRQLNELIEKTLLVRGIKVNGYVVHGTQEGFAKYRPSRTALNENYYLLSAEGKLTITKEKPVDYLTLGANLISFEYWYDKLSNHQKAGELVLLNFDEEAWRNLSV